MFFAKNTNHYKFRISQDLNPLRLGRVTFIFPLPSLQSLAFVGSQGKAIEGHSKGMV